VYVTAFNKLVTEMVEFGYQATSADNQSLLAHLFLTGLGGGRFTFGLRSEQDKITPALTIMEAQALAQKWDADHTWFDGKDDQADAVSSSANLTEVEAMRAEIKSLKKAWEAKAKPTKGKTFCHACNGREAEHNTKDCKKSKKDPVQHAKYLASEAAYQKRVEEQKTKGGKA
jgi:hypothetical protein